MAKSGELGVDKNGGAKWNGGGGALRLGLLGVLGPSLEKI